MIFISFYQSRPQRHKLILLIAAFLLIIFLKLIQHADAIKEVQSKLTSLPPFYESDSQKFHRNIVTSRLAICENVGHIPMEEIPKKTARAVLIF